MKKHHFISIGEHILPTLLAVSEREQMVGLMGVPYPPPNMAFVYGSPRINSFWMKSTPSPLDIVFSCRGNITDILPGEPYSTKLISSSCPSDLIVELPQGTCKLLNITPGTSIKLI